jgi:hypothetical protein
MRVFGSSVSLNTLFKWVSKVRKTPSVDSRSKEKFNEFKYGGNQKRELLYKNHSAKKNMSLVFKSLGRGEAAVLMDYRDSTKNRIKSKIASIICG